MRLILLLLAFVSVNLEYLFLLLFLLQKYAPLQVTLGYLAADAVLMGLSYALGLGLELIVPDWVVGGVGLLPLVFALHAKSPTDPALSPQAATVAVVLTVLAVTTRCHLALYLPILTGIGATEALLAGVLIGVATVVVMLAASTVARHPAWAAEIQARSLAPTKACYVLVGAYVMWDSDLLGQLQTAVRAALLALGG
ncbi:hypothetical protein [Lacticaseibacillus parakribbianus]|uniref:hypothetical protein n=1 Tax=Lacticaseibacillus parakribbianus TaxID=2970927 RepID=UPI0021CB0113|nr:hypothetical protein [Lacticaseibacillus parakribbianus]